LSLAADSYQVQGVQRWRPDVLSLMAFSWKAQADLLFS